MRKMKRDKHPIKATGHAQMLSQEILAGLRRNSTEQVSMDEDSMENIDAYWNMANKELEEMERKQYEDISLLETMKEIGNTSRRSSLETLHRSTKEEVKAWDEENNGRDQENTFLSSPQTIRRSFDEEFQGNLQNVILTGFSDSEEETENENGKTSVKKEKKKQGRKKSKKEDRKEIGNKKKEKKEKSNLLYIESIKDKEETKEIFGNGMKIVNLNLKPKKARKVKSKCFYYIIRGTLVIKDANIPKKEKVSVVYRTKEIEGKQLKAGAVFSNKKATVVYNPGLSLCTLLVLSQKKKSEK